MTPEEEQAFFEAQAAGGSREAAGWALRLMEPRGIAAAMDLDEYLQKLIIDRRAVLLMQLVKLTGEVGVGCPDAATLKWKLRHMRDNPLPGTEDFAP